MYIVIRHIMNDNRENVVVYMCVDRDVSIIVAWEDSKIQTKQATLLVTGICPLTLFWWLFSIFILTMLRSNLYIYYFFHSRKSGETYIIKHSSREVKLFGVCWILSIIHIYAMNGTWKDSGKMYLVVIRMKTDSL